MTPTDTTVVPLTQARAAIADLTSQLRALADPDDEPTPRIREQLIQQHQMLLARRDHLLRLVYFVVNLPPRPTEWLSLLQSAISEFEAELATLEDTRPSHPTDPSLIRAAERREQGVRESLRVLHRGVESFPTGELMPDPLAAWFESHGVQPVGGRWFNGRAGLRRTADRIAEVEKEHEVAVGELSHYLAIYTDAPVTTTPATSESASESASA